MDRRKFLHNIALLTASVVAADQLEILERLTHKRKFFPSVYIHKEYKAGFIISKQMIDDDLYGAGMWDIDFANENDTVVRISQIDESQIFIPSRLWRGVQGA